MMAATKHGLQPSQGLGWPALGYHKQEGATPQPGLRKHCFRNDGKPDERFGVRVGTWIIGSMSGRGTEVCEELRKRRLDLCCLQEIRWRGQGARFLGVKGTRYKLWWSGNSDGTGGVGSFGEEGAMRKDCGGAKEE